jgi:pimeloyl-ACP methyl ester carboxylesterase
MSIPGVGELIYRPWLHDKIGMRRRIFHRPPDFLDDLLPELYRVRLLPGARTAMLRSVRSSISCWGLHRDQNILERLRDLPVPLMTVWGEKDSIIPISHAESVREVLPGSIVYTVPDCGHWPQMEKHELFNSLLSSFLGGTLQSSPNNNIHPGH